MKKLTLIAWLLLTAPALFAQQSDSTATADQLGETALMLELAEESQTRAVDGTILWNARFEGAEEIRTPEELYRKIHTILREIWRSPGHDEIVSQDDDRLTARMKLVRIASGRRFGFGFDCSVHLLRDTASADVELRCTEREFDGEVRNPAECFPFRDEADVPFGVKKQEFAQWLLLESALRSLRYSLQFELAGGL